MHAQTILATTLSAALLVGCSDKTPLDSSSPDPDPAAKLTVSTTKAAGTAERRPGRPAADTDQAEGQGRWSLAGWLEGEYAQDLNGDDSIDGADFQLFVDKRPNDGSLVPVEDPTIAPRPPFGEGAVNNYATLADNLQLAGLEMTATDALDQPFIPVPGQGLSIDGETIQAFEFADDGAARTFASEISADGSQIGTTLVNWIGPPHFFLAGRLLVLYVGEHPDLLPILDKLLGPPFAGRKSPLPEPLPEPDRADLLERPTLFIAASKADAEPLFSWIADPEALEQIRSVDFEQARLVVAFRGRMNTAGFDLDIVQLGAEEDRVQVTVELTDPDPEALLAQVITYPYDLIIVPHSDLPATPTAWEMVTTTGEFLVGASYPPAQGSTSGGETPVADPVVIVDIDPVADSTADNEEPDALDRIDIRGEIVTLTPGEGLGWAEDLLGSIRVEGILAEDTQVDQAIVTVDQNTRLWLESEGILLEIGFADLKEAQLVEVQFFGPVAESYPVQAVAGRIVVLD